MGSKFIKKRWSKEMNKKLIMIIVIIAILLILFIVSIIGFCIFLGSMDWAKIIGDFLGRIWGNEY
ncbi:hypothetical protein ES702_02848 [subsurface metagenome]